MSKEQVFRAEVETDLGTWLIAGTQHGLGFLAFDAGDAHSSFASYLERVGSKEVVEGTTEHLTAASQQLAEYAAGRRHSFDVQLDLRGTEFELAVWNELRRIPYGETRTYGELARAMGEPNAARAIGGANGRNPLPVIVPCHRVVAADGLGGFSGGAGVKERLLHLEGALLFD